MFILVKNQKRITINTLDKGKFALSRKGKLVQICDSHSACCILGDKDYADGLYSVQEIGYDFEEDLGFQGCVFLR